MFLKPLWCESNVHFESKPVLLEECSALPASQSPRQDVPPNIQNEVKKKNCFWETGLLSRKGISFVKTSEIKRWGAKKVPTKACYTTKGDWRNEAFKGTKPFLFLWHSVFLNVTSIPRIQTQNTFHQAKHKPDQKLNSWPPFNTRPSEG